MADGLGLLAAFLVTAPQAINAKTDDQTLKAFDFPYNLDHDEAFAALETLIEERPDDPAAYRTVAAIVWLRILFLRSAVLVDHYLAGSISRSSGKPQEPPEDLDWSFQRRLGWAGRILPGIDLQAVIAGDPGR